jgi:isopenicillin N synthase-like dioxygenase
MGFITVAPTASLPGLTMMSKDCVKWLDVETSTGSGDQGKAPRARFVVFTGETLARLTRGAVRAPLHYVDETVLGQKRISAPFFLRGVSLVSGF